MKKLIAILTFVFVSMLANPVFAGTTVVEGDEAKALFEAQKGSAKILAQKDKKFILRVGGSETVSPKEMKVKVGETFFLTNEEEKYVHNVYDNSDNSWVLKKQKPSEVAAITFGDSGTHKLRCAIHPKMKIKVVIE